jgi:Holliday junction resolvase RusA-like endonuclease
VARKPKRVRIVIEGAPVPKARPRSVRPGVFYTPTKTREAEKRIAELVEENGVTFPPEAVLSVWIWFHEKRARADVDNLAKLVLDGLEKGGLFTNDKQIATLHIERHAVPSEDEAKTVVEVGEGRS